MRQADFFRGKPKGITFPYSSGGSHLVAFFLKWLGTTNSMIFAINHPTYKNKTGAKKFFILTNLYRWIQAEETSFCCCMKSNRKKRKRPGPIEPRAHSLAALPQNCSSTAIAEAYLKCTASLPADLASTQELRRIHAAATEPACSPSLLPLSCYRVRTSREGRLVVPVYRELSCSK